MKRVGVGIFMAMVCLVVVGCGSNSGKVTFPKATKSEGNSVIPEKTESSSDSAEKQLTKLLDEFEDELDNKIDLKLDNKNKVVDVSILSEALVDVLTSGEDIKNTSQAWEDVILTIDKEVLKVDNGYSIRLINPTDSKKTLIESLEGSLIKNDIEKKFIKKPLRQGEVWEVPGNWSLTVHSAEVTEDRNQFSDKMPEQVVIVSYSYENLGYEGGIQDLYLRPSIVVDSNGEVAELYPAKTTSAKPTPIGAKMVGAEEAYGLNNSGGIIKIQFSDYDNSGTEQKVEFEVEVQ